MSSFRVNENACTRPESVDELKKSRREAHAQRTREKRASDLNVIEAIVEVETISLHPSRPYGLPVEMEGSRTHIWDSILEHVDDFETIINLREVCVIFNELLHRKFIAAMLPQVIGNRFMDMSMEWEGGRQGWLNSLSGLRLLSKTSRTSVDSIINAGLLGGDRADWFTTQEPHYLIRRETAILRLGVSQIELDRLDRIFDQLDIESKPEDIFPLTSVIVDEVPPYMFVDVNQDLPILRDDLELLFEDMIGRNITSFLYQTHEDSFETYANLVSWVTHMPNLQDLIVELQGPTMLKDWEKSERMTIEPFPTCPRLKRYAEGRNGFGVPFSKEILRANPTIQEVLLGNTLSPANEWDNVREMLNTLQITKFHIVCMPDIPFFQYKFRWAEHLTTLAFWDPCSIFRIWGQGDINSDVLFNFISTFMNLKKLLVSTPYVRDTGGSLKLLKLKHLVWGVFPTFKTLQFLEPAEGLASLDLDVSMCADTQRPRRAFKYLDEWNVPSLFPALKRIRVRVHKEGRFMTIWTSGSG